MPTPKLRSSDLRRYQRREPLASESKANKSPPRVPVTVPSVSDALRVLSVGYASSSSAGRLPSNHVPGAHIEAIKNRTREVTRFAPERERVCLADPSFIPETQMPASRLVLFSTPQHGEQEDRPPSAAAMVAPVPVPLPPAVPVPRMVADDVRLAVDQALASLARGQKETEGEGAGEKKAAGRKHKARWTDSDDEEEEEESEEESEDDSDAEEDEQAPASSVADALQGVDFEAVKMQSQRQRRRVKIPNKSLEVVQNWFRERVAFPYPTEDEKRELMKKANMDDKQLNNWFTNTRKRFWYQHPTDRSKNLLLTERVDKVIARGELPAPHTSGKGNKAAATKSSKRAKKTSKDSSDDEHKE